MGNSPRYLYCNSIAGFLNDNKDSIFGILNENSNNADLPTQKDAWIEEISIMKDVLIKWKDENGSIILNTTYLV